MSDKQLYIRFCVEAINRKDDKPRAQKFIRALRELVEKCPDVTNEELSELLQQADRELVKL